MMGIFSLVTFTSCSDDDPVIDTGSGGINVANGMYLAAEGQDPVSSKGLSAENVEAPDFQTQARDGFVGGYMWLDAGNYNVVQVVDKEVTTTIGGSIESVEDEGSACDQNTYSVVTTAAGGPAFNVATSGLYKVTHDTQRGELVMHQITSASMIGAATPNGWGGDTELPGTIASDGATFSLAGVIMRSGEWKMRFNCRWTVGRLVDPNGGLDASNGYVTFTNLGGTTDNLVPGGSNIQLAEDGEYTVTLSWTPQNGWTSTVLRTGDAPDLTFDPNDHNWGILGDATANEWVEDRNMLYKSGGEGVHNWYGVVTFAETGKFKLRINDSWDFLNLGGVLAADGVPTTLDVGGADIDTPGAGDYYITLNTSDDGTTWTATMTEFGWSLIGAGSPSGSWEVDTDLVAEGFVDGVSTYTYTGDFTTDGWKFRAGHDWNLNLGENLATLILDGGDISLTEAGTYKVTMTFDGANYAATVDKQ